MMYQQLGTKMKFQNIKLHNCHKLDDVHEMQGILSQLLSSVFGFANSEVEEHHAQLVIEALGDRITVGYVYDFVYDGHQRQASLVALDGSVACFVVKIGNNFSEHGDFGVIDSDGVVAIYQAFMDAEAKTRITKIKSLMKPFEEQDLFSGNEEAAISAKGWFVCHDPKNSNFASLLANHTAMYLSEDGTMTAVNSIKGWETGQMHVGERKNFAVVNTPNGEKTIDASRVFFSILETPDFTHLFEVAASIIEDSFWCVSAHDNSTIVEVLQHRKGQYFSDMAYIYFKTRDAALKFIETHKDRQPGEITKDHPDLVALGKDIQQFCIF